MIWSRPNMQLNGPVIKALREANGWTITALAAEVGIAKSTLGGIEAGRHGATPPVAKRIADALGQPFSVILPTPADEAANA